jgi:WD40-like Beta Propeller Repeat
MQVARAAPLEVYGRLPALENIALSPDGSRLAFVRTVDTNRIPAIAEFPNKWLRARTPNGASWRSTS